MLARYREPSCARSTVELVITAVPLVILWILMWAALGTGYWFGLLLAVPAAGFLVRLFMIQHDCGHGAFFRRRRANDWVGRIIGVLTLTPYDFWRHSHALHHANSRTAGSVGLRGGAERFRTSTSNQGLGPRVRQLSAFDTETEIFRRVAPLQLGVMS
jgi:acyl-lipid omega-6 desaturase (Delta-12 desaturase)